MHNSDVPLKQNYDLLSFYFRPMTIGIFKFTLPSSWASLLRPADEFRVTWSEQVSLEYVTEMH